MGEPIVEFRDVRKRFGRLAVLSGVDLALERGKTTVVIGESGTGKSVLLKHMVGLIHPDSGEVYFDGQRIDKLKERQLGPVRQRFGFLFQMGALVRLDDRRAERGLPAAGAHPLVAEEINDIVARKLALVGLDGIQPKRPAELSGGQRNASPWPGPSPWTRRSSSTTSPPPASTRSAPTRSTT